MNESTGSKKIKQEALDETVFRVLEELRQLQSFHSSNRNSSSGRTSSSDSSSNIVGSRDVGSEGRGSSVSSEAQDGSRVPQASQKQQQQQQQQQQPQPQQPQQQPKPPRTFPPYCVFNGGTDAWLDIGNRD